jgi:hypothetical protein
MVSIGELFELLNHRAKYLKQTKHLHQIIKLIGLKDSLALIMRLIQKPNGPITQLNQNGINTANKPNQIPAINGQLHNQLRQILTAKQLVLQHKFAQQLNTNPR